MSNVSISLLDSLTPEDIHTDVMVYEDGRRFVSLRLGWDCSIILPGFDADSIAFARAIAAATTRAADELEAALQAAPAVERAS